MWKLVLLAAALAACKGKGSPGAGSATAGSATVATKPPPNLEIPPSNAAATAEILAKFDAACTAGAAKACFDSGMRRAKGMGTTADRVAALTWLEKGCTGDDMESCNLLAGFLATGDQGVSKDTKRAFDLHAKACPRLAAACTSLSFFYGSGEVVPKDIAKAVSLLEQGCNGGDGAGCEKLAALYEKGVVVPADAAKAFSWAQKACDTDAYNCETLGAYYLGGTGTAEDHDKGVSYVQKACTAGSQKACDGLKILNGEQ